MKQYFKNKWLKYCILMKGLSLPSLQLSILSIQIKFPAGG